MARRSDIDWLSIEAEFRLGQKSNKQLAVEYGVQPSTIGRRAERYEWLQDKRAEVRVRAANMVVIDTSANANGNANNANKANNAAPSAFAVKVAARVAADVVMSHRTGLTRAQSLLDSLFGELEMESTPEGQGAIEALLDLTREPEDGETPAEKTERRRKQRAELDRRLGLGERIDKLKRLADTQARVYEGQREAFNIKTEESGAAGELAALLSRLGRSSLPIAIAMDIVEDQ